jgi:hypothetical protein
MKNEPVYLTDKLEAYAKRVPCTVILRNFKPALQEMYEICEAHYKPALVDGLSKKQVLAILENAFNSWDDFAKGMAETNVLLSEALLKFSYKFAWTRDAKNVAIYAMLKTD